MDLLGLALSLTLPLQAGRFTGDYHFDVNPTVSIPAPVGNVGAAAMTLPGAVLYDPHEFHLWEQQGRSWNDIMREELMHVEQQAALGPGFWASYLATGGRPFEPYDPIAETLGVAASMTADEMLMNYDQMWMPPDDMRGQYPLFRLSRDDGRTKFQLLPGYPEVFRRE